MSNKTSTLIACTLAFIGSLMPWATITTGFGNIDVAGTNGDGVLTLLLAAAIAVFVLIGLQKTALYVIALLAGALGVLICMIDMIDVGTTADTEFASASIGLGLFVCLFGFIGAVAATIRLRHEIKKSNTWAEWPVPTETFSPHS